MSDHYIPPTLAPEKIPGYLAEVLTARQKRANQTDATAAQAATDLTEWEKFMQEVIGDE